MPRVVTHRQGVTTIFLGKKTPQGTREEKRETWEVEVTIDVEAIALSMGRTAIRNRTGQSIEIGGLVKVKRVKRLD